MDPETHRLLVKLAKLYYEDGLTQMEIGRRLGLSRIKVSRMLRMAREEKVVQIMISPGGKTDTDLEHALENKYGLAETIAVVPSKYSSTTIRAQLGLAAAQCFLRGLKGSETVAITWGRTLSAMVGALTTEHYPDLRVVQGLGGLSEPTSDVDGVDLTRRMAQTLGARAVILSAPGIVNHKLTKDALMKERHIADVLTRTARADIALVGVGIPSSDSVVRTNKVFTEGEIDRLLAKGAVGDIGLRYFDREGIAIRDEVNYRIMGMELEQLKMIPRVIAISGGSEKVSALRAALRGNLINVLVTDDRTARALLQDEDEVGHDG
jgi:DNA-binding transcriptional regulator LsrR (DeoR family)